MSGRHKIAHYIPEIVNESRTITLKALEDIEKRDLYRILHGNIAFIQARKGGNVEVMSLCRYAGSVGCRIQIAVVPKDDA